MYIKIYIKKYFKQILKLIKLNKEIMKLFIEIIKFIIYSLIIVGISKNVLVPILRNLSEALNLKSKTIGSITGIATSMPELLSVSFSAIVGLVDISIFNIISSNVINLILYSMSMLYNRNINKLKNKALTGDIIISIVTIIIPLIILKINIEMNLSIIPLFILLFILFYTINKNSHKMYLKNYSKDNLEEPAVKKKNEFKIILKYTIYLLLTSISLFIFGNLLSQVLDNLSNIFNISQVVIGITLGIVTSIPEFITFFEAQRFNNSNKKQMQGVIETTNNLLISNLINLCVIQSVGIFILNIF